MVLAVVAALLISGTTFAVSSVLSGKAVTAVKVATADDWLWMLSDQWQDIPAMSVTMGVPANQRAVLVITFSAEVSCFDIGWSCPFRALVDGVEVAPGEVDLESSDGVTHIPFGTRTMQWAVGGVRPGTHTVKIQFSKFNHDGNSLRVAHRTLTVLRAVQ